MTSITSRRAFFKNASLTFLAVSASPMIFASEVSSIQSPQLSADTFLPLLKDEFVLIDSEGNAVKTTLVDVTQAKDGKSFSILWETSAKQENVASEIYRVKHRSLGKFDMFISPVEQAQHTQRMEAIHMR